MKKYALLAALCLALISCYFIAKKIATVNPVTESVILLNEADENVTAYVKHPSTKSAEEDVEAAQNWVEQCRILYSESNDEQAANLASLVAAIDVYLHQGSDWQALIPLFRQRYLNLELLNNAYIKFRQSQTTFTYMPVTVQQFLAQHQNSSAEAVSFSDYLLSQFEPAQINQRFKAVEKFVPQRIQGTDLNAFTPAILLIKSAANQEPLEFIHDIRGLEFDSYAAAEALRADLPTESMIQILEQTFELALPVPIAGIYSSFAALNLADVAVDNLNLEGLKWLENKGITATNVVGWGTPIDRAVRFRIADNDDTETLKDKQIQMIKYLSAKGYSAHLSGENYDNNNLGYFSALGHGVNINISQNHNAHLLPLLETLSFIRDKQLPEPDFAAIPQAISTAFSNIEKLQTESAKQSLLCEDAERKLLDAQQLYSRSEINRLLNRDAWDGQSNSVLRDLYNIDPELVRIAVSRWASRSSFHDSDDKPILPTLLHKKEHQAALDYVANTALDLHCTDLLLSEVLQDTSLVSVWKSRVSPLAPSHFWPFMRITLAQLHKLHAAGFDLGLTDIAGQDIYSFAIFELSDEHIEVLLTLSPPGNSAYGVDALDSLLDKIYLQGVLPAYTDKLLTYFNTLEPNHLSRLSRLKLFKPMLYQSLISAHPRLAVGDEIKPNPVVYSRR